MIDKRQFGSIPNSSATYALISTLHFWNKSTDGNGSTIRIMLFDFRKAFDMIDHHILARENCQNTTFQNLYCTGFPYRSQSESKT